MTTYIAFLKKELADTRELRAKNYNKLTSLRALAYDGLKDTANKKGVQELAAIIDEIGDTVQNLQAHWETLTEQIHGIENGTIKLTTKRDQ